MKRIIVFLGRNWLRDNIHIKYWVCKCNPPPKKNKPQKKKPKQKTNPTVTILAKQSLNGF